MIWAKIMFTIGPTGHYIDHWVRFATNEMTKAVYDADSLCVGYYLGCGMRAHLEILQTVSPGSGVESFDLSDNPQGLFNKLQAYRDKHK